MVTLFTLAGCRAFAEEAAPPAMEEVAVVAPSAQASDRPAPALPSAEPVESSAPPGSRAWEGVLPETGRDEYSENYCTHTIQMKNVTVEVTIGSDGAPVQAKVTAIAVDTSCLLVPDHDSHVYTLKPGGWSNLPDNNKRIELVAAKATTQASLVLIGRFDQGDPAGVTLHWQRTSAAAPSDWRVVASVSLTSTPP